VKRVPAEYVILSSFVAAALFWGWLILFGSWRTYGSGYLAAILAVGFLAIGVSACWLVIKRRVAGAWLCALFYGIQVLSFPLPVGAPFKFTSLPTIHFRLNSDPVAPVSLNVLALILLIVSLALVVHYRERGQIASRVSPNTSL
jgi:hypothetical protein